MRRLATALVAAAVDCCSCSTGLPQPRPTPPSPAPRPSSSPPQRGPGRPTACRRSRSTASWSPSPGAGPTSMAAAGAISHNPNLARRSRPHWPCSARTSAPAPTSTAVMQAFVNSAAPLPQHRRPRFDHVGVGVTWGPTAACTRPTSSWTSPTARLRRRPPPRAPRPGSAPAAARARTGTCTARRAGTPAAAAHRPAAAAPAARPRCWPPWPRSTPASTDRPRAAGAWPTAGVQRMP